MEPEPRIVEKNQPNAKGSNSIGSSKTIDTPRLNKVLQNCESWTARWGVANVAAAVVGPSGIVASCGDLDRSFGLASVTKLLFAYGVHVAIEEGTLRLDQQCGPASATVAHLLAHTSGLDFEGRRVLAEPGVERLYSNAGFDVLGSGLSESSGIRAVDYVREAVLLPLGMSKSWIRGSVAKDGIGTVSDLASFARECLRPKLLSPTTVTTMNEVAFPGTSGRVPGVGWFTDNKWGLGPEIRGIKSPHWTGSKNSAQTWGHFGGAGTFVWIDPAADHALVCATDKPFGAWALQAWPSLSDSVLNELFLDQTP